VSLSGLIATVVLPVSLYALGKMQGQVDVGRLLLAVALVVVVWVRHTSNIARLLQGNEKSVLAGRRGRSK
jgi:glycerol-3-phosphate acyltransferase PlsY